MPLFHRTATPTLDRLRRAPADLAEVLTARTPAAVTMWLGATPTDEVDAQVAALDRHGLAQLADVLTPVTAARLMDRLEPHTAGMLLDAVGTPTAAGLLGLLPEDEASRVVRTLDADVAARVLADLPHAESALLRGLLAWPQESAAAWMRPAYLRVDAGATLADALAAARHDPEEAEEGVYVVHPRSEPGEKATLAGWLPLRALVVAASDTPVTKAMLSTDEIADWSVTALADQEHVLRAAEDSPDGAVPVLQDGVLLGVITRDGVLDTSARRRATRTPHCRAARRRWGVPTCRRRRGGCGGPARRGWRCCSWPRCTPGRCCAPSRMNSPTSSRWHSSSRC